ncbi:MFS transporter [Paenibacillus lycopersici]|uniref:MFS transporter n=1 Tax=Paenibacillus lycopersici TaxID=2704462 RepID=A0A6C0G2A2_9BACL|nr:MFS transporter [Paenibacillus lycopersici]QHT58785.1 MFS transporter [Paenibacillus lycopersici]
MPAVALSRRRSLAFSLLCCLVYFTSYMTRLNYGAAISEIGDALHVSNQLAGMALIGSSVAYGIGQPLFGFAGDRLSPRHMIAVGLAGTALLNAAVACTDSIGLITAIWCLNGLFQAMLWPPLVRIMTQTLSREAYNNASVGIVAAASAGTIGVYLLVPLCIVFAGWRLSFVIPAALSMLVAAVWFAGAGKFSPSVSVSKAAGEAAASGMEAAAIEIEAAGTASARGDAAQEGTATADAMPAAANPIDARPASAKAITLIMASGLLPILLAITLQGALRDGITTWMPTFIGDTYGFGNSSAILSTAILPLFTIVSVSAASFVQRILRNEVRTSALLWTAACAAAGLLAAFYDANAAIGIALIAVLTGCMHGVNMMLISLLPMHFASAGKASTISGILNAFSYLGSASSIYGIAALSEGYGWRITICAWCVMAIAGMILCGACAKRWNRFAAEAAGSRL